MGGTIIEAGVLQDRQSQPFRSDFKVEGAGAERLDEELSRVSRRL
jgi:hypothetical protein